MGPAIKNNKIRITIKRERKVMQILNLDKKIEDEKLIIDHVKNWYKKNGECIIPTLFTFSEKELIISLIPEIGNRENGFREKCIYIARFGTES